MLMMLMDWIRSIFRVNVVVQLMVLLLHVVEAITHLGRLMLTIVRITAVHAAAEQLLLLMVLSTNTTTCRCSSIVAVQHFYKVMLLLVWNDEIVVILLLLMLVRVRL